MVGQDRVSSDMATNLFNGQNDSVVALDAYRCAAVFDGFRGVLDLENPAVRAARRGEGRRRRAR